MKYKIIFFILGIFFIFNGIIFSALTKEDVQEIRMIIREELRPIEERINGLEKRLDGRIDSLEKRIEDLRLTTLTGFGILFTGMFCLIGFVIWDRRTTLKPAIVEIEELKNRNARVEEALRKIGYQDEKIAAILKSLNIL